MKTEGGLGLIDEGCNVANVDGLVQIDELSFLPQAIKELTEILLH